MEEMLYISYVYIHRTADTHVPFYVGKGFGNRAFAKFRSKWWKNVVDKHGYTVEFVETELTDKQACELEIELIRKIGRRDQGMGTLVNLTDGGEGITNPSAETREKLSKNRLGKPHTVESREKIRASMTGKTPSWMLRDDASEIRSKMRKGTIESESHKKMETKTL